MGRGGKHDTSSPDYSSSKGTLAAEAGFFFHGVGPTGEDSKDSMDAVGKVPVFAKNSKQHHRKLAWVEAAVCTVSSSFTLVAAALLVRRAVLG